MKHSIEFKEKMVYLYKGGRSAASLAREFPVSSASIYSWAKDIRENLKIKK